MVTLLQVHITSSLTTTSCLIQMQVKQVALVELFTQDSMYINMSSFITMNYVEYYVRIVGL
jgi:hypothetical protein